MTRLIRPVRNPVMKLHLLIALLFTSLLGQSAFAQRTELLQHLWEVQPNLGDIWSDEPVEAVILFDVENLKSKDLHERVRVASRFVENTTTAILRIAIAPKNFSWKH